MGGANPQTTQPAMTGVSGNTNPIIMPKYPLHPTQAMQDLRAAGANARMGKLNNEGKVILTPEEAAFDKAATKVEQEGKYQRDAKPLSSIDQIEQGLKDAEIA